MIRIHTIPSALSALLILGAGCAARRNSPPPAYVAPPPAYTPPPPAPAAAPAPVPLERWAEVHPQAARELGDWARAHPQAARRFFEWDGHHPERAQEFVGWTTAHPSDGLNAFVATHPGWPFFNEVMKQHRPAADAFMAWCRRHPPAAEALMHHPRGLQWAGHNLYRM
jgi:hypothetical protein